MALFREGLPHCKRCKVELEGSENTCPECAFAPKEIGLRLTGMAFLGVIVFMTVAQISVMVHPPIGLIFMLLAGGSFALTLVIFLTAMLATPYRFGELFKRF